MSRKDKIFSYIIFIFGIVLFIFAFGLLIYQIVHTISINWSGFESETEYKATRSYVIVEFITIIFKLVISGYAISCSKHLDEAINPLFTFTCLYFVFVILQTIMYFFNGGLSLDPIVSATAIIDMIITVFIFTITLLLKIDDWRNIVE